MMQIKTYQTDSVLGAIEQIRKELGPNAVILDTQKTRSRRFLGLFDKLAYTITAASEPSQEKVPEESLPDTYEAATTPLTPEGRLTETDPGLTASKIDPPAFPGTTTDLQELGARMESLHEDLRHLKLLLGEGRLSPDRGAKDEASVQLWRLLTDSLEPKPDWLKTRSLLEEFHYLRNQGVEDGIAASLLRSSLASIDAEQELEPQLRHHLNKALAGMIQTAPFQGGSEGTEKAIFFGPTGVGKTTTIAKLAAELAIRERRKVQLITLDNYRIGAAEQLRIYGEIIGVPVRVVGNVSELDQALSESPEGSPVLVDTTGHSHKRIHEFEGLASYLRANSKLEKHLVLSTTTKPEDLREIIRSFEAFSPGKLLFTKVDETSTFGAIANSLIGTGKPLSYLTNGQAVPEDLLMPTPDLVGDMLLPLN